MSTMHDSGTNLLAATSPGQVLHGRRVEREMLDRLVADVRSGQSRVLVLRGEPGTGKTALLDYLAHRAADCRVVRVTGVKPEMELAFAGLHQLCAPFLPGELAGGYVLPSLVPAPGQIEEDYRRQFAALPATTRLLLLIAAAEPAGDPVLIWRAAGHLGLQADAAEPAVAAGLVEFTSQVRFCHPRARTAAYLAAALRQRQCVHRALAEAADSEVSPDQRAWHLAHATSHLDEDVAAALACSAGQAGARGGLAAAAAFGERAAELTPEPACRARRALDAAQAKREAGALDVARRLLAMAQCGPLGELGMVRSELLRAQLETRPGRALLLVDVAGRLGPLDAGLAREAYREAFDAALTAGCPGTVRQVAEAIKAAYPFRPSCAPDLLLDALASLVTAGHRAGAPMLRRAVHAFRAHALCAEAMPAPEALRWLSFACRMSAAAWDDESWHALSARLIELARRVGALTLLPDALQDGIVLQLTIGETGTAAAMAREEQTVVAAIGNSFRPDGGLLVAAWRGQEAVASRLTSAADTDCGPHEDGRRPAAAAWAAAILNNGLCRYDEALTAAEQASADPDELGLVAWALAELIEAAARIGSPEPGSGALGRLCEITSAAATDWALGIQARSTALLSNDDHAEQLYIEAISRLGRTRMRAELARAHLLYGEWLRRQGRRRDAREPLRTAYQMLDAMRMEAFAERARRELLATGETARKRTIETVNELTAQEAQIARLARDGRSNTEISTQLFISPRTVEWHLGKVFIKLGISSRKELRAALPDLDLGRSPHNQGLSWSLAGVAIK
jgi:DNA-binding CsgD family transcriptional regulator